MRRFLFFVFAALLFASCSVSKKLERSAQENVLTAEVLRTAHVGISVFEPATGKRWYDYQGDKYFVPASNTKIPTCYAAMKYLGDSLVGIEYSLENSTLIFRGSGDPTLLHPDFKKQPALEFLRTQKQRIAIEGAKFKTSRWGSGWSVSDINASYSPEKSELPVYGNVLRIFKNGESISTMPSMFSSNVNSAKVKGWRISFERPSLNENIFESIQAEKNFATQEVPFITGNYMTAWVLLMDTLKKDIGYLEGIGSKERSWYKIHSQPTDSLLRPMMHRSDNFFAEQSLLMVSNERLGYMSDAAIIDTILKTDFKDLPQKPRWVDGSGLSCYNLFTPQDFVFILNKMKNEFGMDRIKNIFATGGEGTLSNYYGKEKDVLFAKTGTLSGVVALSGFLTTKKGKELIFSVQVNNHNGSATGVRRAVEKFIKGIREKY